MLGLISRAKKVSLVAAALVAGASSGCAADHESNDEVLGEAVSQPVVAGTPASGYTEAALVNGSSFICSGAVIAPKVVLTAGHCVAERTSWTVMTPYANKQTAKSVGAWTEYTQTGDFVNPKTLDVALIFLDRAIPLPAYPALAKTAVASGTKVVNVGRIDDGVASSSALFFGRDVTVRPGGQFGFPSSYVTEEVIQPGDSGGPVYLAGHSSPRTIVAVNSGGGNGTQVLARVDLVFDKIQQLIAQNGGPGGGATAAPTPTPTPTPTPAPAPAPACSGAAESEPNDASNQPNALGASACGALATGADVDWYSWSVDKAGVAYEVALAAQADANVLMWRSNGTTWSRVQNTSPTRIAATSSAAGNYLVAVRSAGSVAQSYSLALTR